VTNLRTVCAQINQLQQSFDTKQPHLAE